MRFVRKFLKTKVALGQYLVITIFTLTAFPGAYALNSESKYIAVSTESQQRIQEIEALIAESDQLLSDREFSAAALAAEKAVLLARLLPSQPLELYSDLNKIFGAYSISPEGAIVRYLVPIFNIWGIWFIFNTLSVRLLSSSLTIPKFV